MSQLKFSYAGVSAALLVLAAVIFSIDALPNEPGFASAGASGMPSKVHAFLQAEWFGGWHHAVEYLEGRGLRLDRDLNWYVPAGVVLCHRDFRAIAFLAVEWGYGKEVIEEAATVPPFHERH